MIRNRTFSAVALLATAWSVSDVAAGPQSVVGGTWKSKYKDSEP